MIFINHFLLLNYIILNYDNLKHDLILVDTIIKKEQFLPTDQYILWHAKNIGTELNEFKMLSGIVPLINIRSKPKKYYINILIKNEDNFLPFAFFDIFFNKCKLGILLSGFMRNYKYNFSNISNTLQNYNVDYYLCTYNILGMGNRDSDNYSKEIFDINDIKKIIPIKKYIIREYDKCDKISDDIIINKAYYNSLNSYECYNLIEENYMFYIKIRPDFQFEDLNLIIEKYFDELIDNKIILNGVSENTENWELINNLPNDYICISNILTSQIYFKFHLDIFKFDESYEKTLNNFLYEKNIKYIKTKLGIINRKKLQLITNKSMLLRLHK